MLTDKKVKAFLITTDAVAAKEFYSQVLGFKFLTEDGHGLEFEMSNSLLRVSITREQNALAQNHTVLGWCVPDIYETLDSLLSKGIQFERFDYFKQDEKGVWQAPGGT
jgi:predicted enzyme related to lactoylglutathione lyase